MCTNICRQNEPILLRPLKIARLGPPSFNLLWSFMQQKCVSNVFIVWVYLEKGLCRGDFFNLPPKHFMFAISFFFGDAHIASHNLFDGHQEGDGYLLTLKFGEGLLPCLHHLIWWQRPIWALWCQRKHWLEVSLGCLNESIKRSVNDLRIISLRLLVLWCHFLYQGRMKYRNNWCGKRPLGCLCAHCRKWMFLK